jgi:hypothetical protein
MVFTLLLILGCILSLVVAAGLAVGIFFILQNNRHDSVSSAREDWISASSEDNEAEQ